jgi:hypothetical protein
MKLPILALVLFCGAAVGGQQQVLTNDDVAKMAQAGIAQDIIMKTIGTSVVQFQLGPDHLIALKKAGVSDDIVRAMTAARNAEKPTLRLVRFSSEEQAVAPTPRRGTKGAGGPLVPAGAKIFVEAADGFDMYLTAALQEKRVPVVVVTEKSKADYDLSGVSDQEKAGWSKLVLLQIHPEEHAGVKLVNIKTGEVVFAYAVNKANSVHGRQTAAEACAKHMKKVVSSE